MNRRVFLCWLTLSTLARPHRVGAQPLKNRLPRVGVLWHGRPSAPIVLRVTETLTQGLQEHGGYVPGQNIVMEYRYAELEEMRSAANDLVRLNVDVIVAGGTPAAIAAKRATSTIPIVGGAMADPVADGLVASLARPGGNVTGNTFIAPELVQKRLQLLREVVPGVTKVAALQHPGVYGERTMRDMLNDMETRARASGIELHVFGARSPNDFDDVFAAAARLRAGALIMFPSPMFYVNYQRLVDLAAKHHLPTIYWFREAVEAGGLMCYGANIPDLFRRAAKYVVEIIKGANPGNLPVEQPSTFDFVINLKTAKTLGLTIPPSLLARADQVIE